MRFGTCNTEPLPSECNSLRQVDDRDQNPKRSYARSKQVTGEFLRTTGVLLPRSATLLEEYTKM
jgi:hypothetical protein